MKNLILEIFKYRSLLIELLKRDLKKKYYKSFLGVMWTILSPLMMMTVLTFLFSTLFKRSIEHFPIFYMCGWLIFDFNAEATTTALHAIVDNAALIRKIYVPTYLFCVSKVLLAMVNKLFSLIPLFLVMIVLHVPFHWTILLIPLLLVPLFFFSLGLGLGLASLAVHLRDTFHLYSILIMMWMYLSAIFYPITIIPEQFQVLWNYNPLYHFIVIMRELVLYGNLPTTTTVLYAVSYSVLMMGIGIALYRKLQKNFMLHI